MVSKIGVIRAITQSITRFVIQSSGCAAFVAGNYCSLLKGRALCQSVVVTFLLIRRRAHKNFDKIQLRNNSKR
jgi:hypothetical protein